MKADLADKFFTFIGAVYDRENIMHAFLKSLVHIPQPEHRMKFLIGVWKIDYTVSNFPVIHVSKQVRNILGRELAKHQSIRIQQRESVHKVLTKYFIDWYFLSRRTAKAVCGASSRSYKKVLLYLHINSTLFC